MSGVLEALGGERLSLGSSPSIGREVGLELDCSPEMGKEGLLHGSRGPLPEDRERERPTEPAVPSLQATADC